MDVCLKPSYGLLGRRVGVFWIIRVNQLLLLFLLRGKCFHHNTRIYFLIKCAIKATYDKVRNQTVG